MNLHDRLFRYDAVENILSDTHLLERMLAFESALAEAEGQLGIIPQNAAAAIVRCCTLKSLDHDSLRDEAGTSGNVAIPFVQQLTAAVRNTDPDAASYVHWGATSQDVIDTAFVLQARSAVEVVCADLDRVCDSLARLTREHQNTVMPGRTWLQHAAPITFGLKTANMLSALLWNRDHLRRAVEQFATVQFGGSVGTLAVLRSDGHRVAAAVAQRLCLAAPSVPWHSSRERVAALAAALGIVNGSIGKIAHDISLLLQTEVAEVAEPWEIGRGGSSTMPQKRNPVTTAMILANVMRVPGLVSTVLASMTQEHERALGGWQAEWEVLPELIRIVAAVAHLASDLFTGLTINADKMKSDLELTNGAIYAEAVSFRLAEKIGKSEAHGVVARASARSAKTRSHLKQVLLKDDEVTRHLSADDIAALFDPARHLGSAQTFIESVLAEYGRRQSHAVR